MLLIILKQIWVWQQAMQLFRKVHASMPHNFLFLFLGPSLSPLSLSLRLSPSVSLLLSPPSLPFSPLLSLPLPLLSYLASLNLSPSLFLSFLSPLSPSLSPALTSSTS